MSEISTANGEDGEFPFLVTDVPSSVYNPESVIRFLVDVLVSAGQIAAESAEEIVDLILKREELGTTAIGRGIAVPHVSTTLVSQPAATAGRLSFPVNWDALGNERVRIVYLCVAPASNPDAQLRLMEMFAKYATRI